MAPLLKLPMLYLVAPVWGLYGMGALWMEALKTFPYLAMLAGILLLTAAWYHYAKTAPVPVLPLSTRNHLDNLRPVLTFGLWRNHFISRLPELCFTYPGLLLAALGVRALRREINCVLGNVVCRDGDLHRPARPVRSDPSL